MYLITADYITEKLRIIRRKLEEQKYNSPDTFEDYIKKIDSIISNDNDSSYFYVDIKFKSIINEIYDTLTINHFSYTLYETKLRDIFIKLSQNQSISLIVKGDKNTKLKFLPEDEKNIIVQLAIFISLITFCGIILLKINNSILNEPISIITFTTFFIALNIYFIYAIYTFKKESSHKKTLQTLLHIYNNNQLDPKQRERFLNFFLSEFSSSKEKAPFDLDFLKFQKSKN